MANKKVVVAEKHEDQENSPVRNTGHDYLRFVNTNYFNEEARRFLRYGYYTDAPVGTPDYYQYWQEQKDRCLNGYTVGGVRIPGRYYFFLNFCVLYARPFNFETGEEGVRKRMTFPRFLDHQYYLAHEIEKVLKEGPYEFDDDYERTGMIIAKARRKGITYFNGGALITYNYNFFADSQNFIGAYEKGHYKVTLDSVHNNVNFLNKSTFWKKRRQNINQRDHFRASFMVTDENGVRYEDGYKSEVKALSFKDNPFKSIGEGASLFCFEEAGRFPDLLTTYRITEPLWRDGSLYTGSPIIWGTSGDLEKGALDFATMFYDPESYGLKSYENIYDDKITGNCGYFIDNMWYYPGKIAKRVFIDGKWVSKKYDLVDSVGNSNRELAEEAMDREREKAKEGDEVAYQNLITQRPKTPKEAFMRPSGSPFPAKELNDHEANLRANPKRWLGREGEKRGELIYDPTKEGYKFEIDWELAPIREYPLKSTSSRMGALTIWEMPPDNTPNNLFISAADPYDDDVSGTESLGSIFIMNRLTDRIVAEYTGRPRSAKEFYEVCRRLLLFYNATCLYESNKKGIFSYFEYHNCLHLLADTPKYLQDKSLVNYRVTGNDSKGVKMNNQNLIMHAASLYKQYLLEEAYQNDENDTKLLNLHTIKSVPLVQESIYWNYDEHKNGKRNFDRISAMFCLMIYRESLNSLHVEIEEEQKQELPSFFKNHPLFRDN